MNTLQSAPLIRAEDLQPRLHDADLCILEIGNDEDDYHQGHLPGAHFVPTMSLLQPDLSQSLQPAQLSALLQRFGIQPETTVVTVANDYLAAAGWVCWLLTLAGHTRTGMLDGGKSYWRGQGLPLTTEPAPQPPPSNYAVQSADAAMRASQQDVQAALADNTATIIDVRTVEEYNGQVYLIAPPEGEERAGHIPGCVHIHYEDLHNPDGTLKPNHELEDLLAAAGVSLQDRIIPYCAVGARSGHVCFILSKLLGAARVQNYDGSWNDWSRSAANPVAT